MIQRHRRVVMLWGIGLLVGGCAKESSSPTILASRPQPFVADVPVPKGFEQDLRRSDHRVVAGKRAITHYYLGRENQRAVRDFYIQHMPQAEWQLLDEKLSAGVYLLNFRKNDESCEIRIEVTPGGFLSSSQVQVRATIKPMYAEAPN